MSKGRNFEGCWTCRSRKIKCDTGKPKCKRCVKAGLECEGYGIKLSFYQVLTVQEEELVDIAKNNHKDATFSRRSMVLNKFSGNMLYQTFRELDSVVQRVDDQVEIGKLNSRIGPFSVYQAQIPGRPDRDTTTNGRSLTYMLNSASLEEEPVELDEDQMITMDGDTESIDEKPSKKRLKLSKLDRKIDTGDELIHKDLIKLAKLSIYGIKGPEYKINDQNLYHISYPTYFPNIDSDEWTLKENYIKRIMTFKQDGKLLTNLGMELLRSFRGIRFGAIKIPHKHNCWDNIITPYINRILFDHVISGDTVESQLTPDPDKLENNIPLLIRSLKVTILLLAISISSFTKSTTKFSVDRNEDIDDHLKISISMRKMGLNLLNYHLDEYDNHVELNNQDYNLLLLLAIILQIEIDNYYNIFENFELLFSIGEISMHGTYDFTSISTGNLAITLTNLFRIMYTFFLSTQRINLYNYKMSEEDIDKYDDLKETYDLTKVQDSDEEEEEEEEDKEENSDLDRDFKQPTIVETTRKLVDETDYNDYTEDIGFKPEEETLTANSVYLLYGIPQSLMKLFYDIVNLTNHKRVFFNEKKFPRNFPKICSEYEDKLEKWDNKWELFKPNTNVYKSQWHESLQINIQIFHQSLKIYFKRLIKNEIHQHLIEPVVKEIDRLLTINPQILINFWTILICSSDNLNRQLHHSFQLLSHRYQNLTYWRSQQLMIEVIKRREHQDPISWMEMIREWDILLYLG